MPIDEQDFITVSALNSQVRELLEETYGEVAVLGEISNFKKHSSGHLYFTLKDAGAQLRAVCFRGDAMRVGFVPEDGMKVIAAGRVTMYEPYGQYQLVAHGLHKVGVGELEIAFRALRDKLEKEGLFAAEHKKALPAYPFCIAVITSPTGAAVRDIVSTVKRRWPCADILLLPVHVQGGEAAPEIVQALSLVARIDDADLVIVGRGGGSLEDLWAFNEESVARAIFACPLPVISAVGHETDFTIADFVADVRAATPTMAAEIAAPAMEDVIGRLDAGMGRLLQSTGDRVRLRSSRVNELLRSYALGQVRGKMDGARQRLDYAMEKLARGVDDAVQNRRVVLQALSAGLETLNPRSILERGYTICSDMASGEVVRTAARAAGMKQLKVSFHDGSLRTEVKERIDGKA
ncbi:MAG: exodeoxyribonuclease VII large subunit [Candidatus Latescibacterota bacterium]